MLYSSNTPELSILKRTDTWNEENPSTMASHSPSLVMGDLASVVTAVLVNDVTKQVGIWNQRFGWNNIGFVLTYEEGVSSEKLSRLHYWSS